MCTNCISTNFLQLRLCMWWSRGTVSLHWHWWSSAKTCLYFYIRLVHLHYDLACCHSHVVDCHSRSDTEFGLTYPHACRLGNRLEVPIHLDSTTCTEGEACFSAVITSCLSLQIQCVPISWPDILQPFTDLVQNHLPRCISSMCIWTVCTLGADNIDPHCGSGPIV